MNGKLKGIHGHDEDNPYDNIDDVKPVKGAIANGGNVYDVPPSKHSLPPKLPKRSTRRGQQEEDQAPPLPDKSALLRQASQSQSKFYDMVVK